jgi:hypothetical protein
LSRDISRCGVAALFTRIGQLLRLRLGVCLTLCRAQAKFVFLAAEAQREMPQILSTSEYDEAQAFSESVYWCD